MFSIFSSYTVFQGNVYIGDTYNNRIRKITVSTGIISTIAGTGTSSYSGDGGAATSATLNWPQGIAFDSSGNIYIADTKNHLIRKVTVSTGIISTIAGTGASSYSGDGGDAKSAALYNPYVITLDSLGIPKIISLYLLHVYSVFFTFYAQVIFTSLTLVITVSERLHLVEHTVLGNYQFFLRSRHV